MFWIVIVGVVIAVGAIIKVFSGRQQHRGEASSPSNSDGSSLDPIDTPWAGRQHRQNSDPSDKPHGYNSWEEAFNRPVTDDLRFKIEYVDSDGVVTTREIRPISIHLLRGKAELYIKARCGLRNDERTFFSPRIQSTINLQTGRKINDLGQYLRGKY